jgi:PAS domain S-box-containing protein
VADPKTGNGHSHDFGSPSEAESRKGPALGHHAAQILESIADPVVAFDREWRYTYVSRRAAKALGKSPEEMVGRGMWELFPDDIDTGFQEACRRAWTEGCPVTVERYSKVLDRWVESYIYPFEDGASSQWRDITARKKSEEALRSGEDRLEASEQRFRGLFDAMQEGFLIGDVISDQNGKPVDWRFREVNPSMAAMLRRTQDEIVGRTYRELFPTAPWQFWVSVFGRVALSGIPDRTEGYGGGTRRFFDAIVHSPAHGQFAAILTDITQRKLAEDAVRQQREWLRVTLGSIGDAVLATDAEGRITLLNATAASLTGWREEDAMGRPFGDVLRMINEETGAAAEDIVIRVLQEGRAIPLGNHTVLVSRDGREIPVEDSAAPIRDTDGRVLGVVLVFRDVTEQRRASQALRDSELQFRTLANAIPQLCWMANADGWIVWYNQRWYEYTGTAPEQMEGWGWQSVHDPAVLPKVLERWSASLATGEIFDMVFPLRGADGVFRPFLTRVMPVHGRDGKVARWFGTNTDISEQRMVEQALRESEEKLRSAFANAAIGFAVTTPEGRFLDVNPAYCAITGHTREELADTDSGRMVHPDDAVENQKLIDRMLAGEIRDFVVESRYVRKDGGPVWVRKSLSAVRHGDGTPRGVIALVEDITERKRQEQELALEVADLKQLQSISSQLIQDEDAGAIYAKILEATVALMRADMGCIQMLDPEANELQLIACTELPEGAPQFPHRTRFDDGGAYGAAMRNRQRVSAADIDSDASGIGAEDRDFCRRSGVKAMQSTPLVSRSGRLFGVISTHWRETHEVSEREARLLDVLARQVADLIERKATEGALRESESRERARAAEMKAIFDSAPVALFVAEDPECRVMAGSRTTYELLRLAPGSNVSKTAPDGQGPTTFRAMKDGREIAPEELPAQQAAATGEPVRNYEFDVVYEDGSSRNMLGDAVPLFDDQGRPRGAVGAFVDITERKRNEERLRQSQKLESIGLLAGGVAHDFNNLLTGILGNASMVLEEVPARPAERIREVMAAAERAAHLTRQLLAYSGKGQFVVRDLDVSEAVQEIGDLVQFSIPKSVQLAVTVEKRLPLVRMDPGQLQQILMNLVINAGEAIGEGNPGRITVATATRHVEADFVDAMGKHVAAGRYVCVEISDTGSGISEEQKGRIFDPFFTTKFTGRGLGLAAVAGIVRSQNGGITVDSQPGAGARFRVFLPAGESRARGREILPDAGARATVLVVDDERSVRDFISAVLRRNGYRVLTAADGREAIGLLKGGEEKIDAAVLDVVMPVMGANELLPVIKRLQPQMKVLLTSGYSESEARRLCADYPDADFIEKPYTAKQISSAVEQLLRTSTNADL